MEWEDDTEWNNNPNRGENKCNSDFAHDVPTEEQLHYNNTHDWDNNTYNTVPCSHHPEIPAVPGHWFHSGRTKRLTDCTIKLYRNWISFWVKAARHDGSTLANWIK